MSADLYSTGLVCKAAGPAFVTDAIPEVLAELVCKAAVPAFIADEIPDVVAGLVKIPNVA